MKYILVLGIEYKKYKKPAGISLFIGEKFIDRFELHQDYSTATNMSSHLEPYWFDTLYKSHWLIKHRGLRKWQDMPQFFKIYEIDGDYIKGMLKLQVENSNSNYTNGFIKNSSVMKFTVVSFFPKPFAVNKAEKLTKICAKLDDAYRVRFHKNHLDTHMHERWQWPTVDSFYVKRYDEKFEKSGIKDYTFWIGGDFTIEIPIKEKHKLKYLSSQKHQEKGFPNTNLVEILTILSCRPLLNIYDENH